MKAYVVTAVILDFDKLGAEGIKDTITNASFPNDCIYPNVEEIVEYDIGKWSNEHPLNKRSTNSLEYLESNCDPKIHSR